MSLAHSHLTRNFQYYHRAIWQYIAKGYKSQVTQNDPDMYATRKQTFPKMVTIIEDHQTKCHRLGMVHFSNPNNSSSQHLLLFLWTTCISVQSSLIHCMRVKVIRLSLIYWISGATPKFKNIENHHAMNRYCVTSGTSGSTWINQSSDTNNKGPHNFIMHNIIHFL